MKKVTLSFKRDYATLHHHPWIFSGAIHAVEGDPTLGETVAVANGKGETIGYGSYSPASQIRVRMLSFDARQVPDAAYIDALVAKAVARRAPFWTRGTTNAVRVVNAENDGLPGVTADCYDGFVVVQLASAGAEYWKETLVAAFMKHVPGCKGVFNRSDVDARVREGLRARGEESGANEIGVLAGAEPPAYIGIHEGPIGYLVDVRKGHKTGFYLDQRDARAAVGAYAAGADMLNCFSYTGGFGLAACAAGAKSVTHLDVSADALALARKNTELTHCGSGGEGTRRPTIGEGGGTVSDFVEADVFKQLRLYRDQGRSFDLIVLDPPKFADTKAGLMRATRGYKDINLLAMKLLRPNGILATFSCSGAMTTDLFDKVCAEAAFDAKRDFQVLTRTRQAAGDHPVALTFPEGLYLKGLILRATN